MTDTLFLDTETFSPVPIKFGAYRYSEDVTLVLVAYALGEGEVRLWEAQYEPIPKDLFHALFETQCTIVMHNSMFDRTVLNKVFGVTLPTYRIADTMVQALMHGYPGSLKTLCSIFDIDTTKSKMDNHNMRLFCLPAKEGKQQAHRESHPDRWQAFKAYAHNDITAMRELYYRLPRHNCNFVETLLWELDQEINDRGFLIDREFVKAAVDAISDTQRAIRQDTARITGNRLDSVTQRDALLKYLETYHQIKLPNLQAATVREALATITDPVAKKLLELRDQATTTSTAKYATLLNAVCSDGRLRGTLQYYGASRTGRWAGRIFQPQNLPRQTMRGEDIAEGIDTLMQSGDVDNVMQLTSNALRGCIIAPQGRMLLAADFSNIEGRVLAWVAGETWKVDAFRAYDQGTGADLYKLAYAKAFGITPEEVTSDQRQIGKVMELALGYGGGVGAFVTFAKGYNLDLEALAERAEKTIPEGILSEAKATYTRLDEDQRKRFIFSPKVYAVCDALKRLWREAHPNTVRLWADAQEAAFQSLASEKSVPFGYENRLVFDKDKLYLPSARVLSYPQMRGLNGGLCYMGVDQFTKKWGQIRTYGGKLVENICQGIARDIMAYAMLDLSQRDFDIVLTVHDEIITEVDASEAQEKLKVLIKVMQTSPTWAQDIPLAAAGFSTNRYKKG